MPPPPWQELKVKVRKNLAFPAMVDCKLRGIWSSIWIISMHSPLIFWKESVIKKSAAGPQAYRSNSSKMDLFPRHFWCATEREVDTSMVAVPSKSSLFSLLQIPKFKAKNCQKAQLLFENMFQRNGFHNHQTLHLFRSTANTSYGSQAFATESWSQATRD